MNIKVYSKEKLKKDFYNFINKNGRLPKAKEFLNKNNLASTTTYYKIFNINNYVDLLQELNVQLNKDEKYQLLVKSGQNRAMVDKEEAKKRILKMQDMLDRPLMYDDFRNPTEKTIGITTLKKYWGTLNKMKKELNLEIIQEDMSHKTPSLQETKEAIKNVCQLIYSKEHRKLITTYDINSNCNVNFWAYSKVFKKNNTTLRDYIISLGFEYQTEGTGMNYFFNNGEKVCSYYELMFSKYIRNQLHLQYNKDYFRDVKYKIINNEYNGNMNCDYMIKYKNRVIYIEIVGMLRDYKNNWRDYEFKSNRKIKYVQHLKLKEQLLIGSNKEYYILFPSDLTEEIIQNIFDN